MTDQNEGQTKAIELTGDYWAKLMHLVGHYKDASDATVKLFWDDATGEACLLVGKDFYFDRSFEAVIDKACTAEFKLEVPR